MFHVKHYRKKGKAAAKSAAAMRGRTFIFYLYKKENTVIIAK